VIIAIVELRMENLSERIMPMVSGLDGWSFLLVTMEAAVWAVAGLISIMTISFFFAYIRTYRLYRSEEHKRVRQAESDHGSAMLERGIASGEAT
jgi:hypothetical protein